MCLSRPFDIVLLWKFRCRRFQENEGLNKSLHGILWKFSQNIVESWVVELGSGVWRMDPPGMWPAPNTHTSHRLWTQNVVKVWPRSPAHHNHPTINIMATVKRSEDIGTVHSVVCVLYGILKSLNSCLICLALWKYEYGFWLFVETKRQFYCYSILWSL